MTLTWALVSALATVTAGFGPLVPLRHVATRRLASPIVRQSTIRWVATAAERVGDVLVPAAMVGGYQRWDESDPLDHDTRADLYDAVESDPGRNVDQLATEVDVPVSTLRYHGRILEREGMVERSTLRGRIRLFPVDADDVEMRLSAVLADDAAATVLSAVESNEPATVSELADAVNRSASTVSYHLDQFESAGLVERRRDGQAVVTTLASSVRDRVADEAT